MLFRQKIKPLFLIPLFILFLSIPEMVTSQNFEGIIQYEIPELQDKIGTDQLDYMIKGNMIRIEYESGKSRSTSILYETETEMMFISIGMLGGHVEVPPDDVQLNFMDEEPDFENTGETRTVDGNTCEVWKATIESNIYHYCFMPETADFILPINSVTAGSVPVWAGVNLPDNHLPLEVNRVQDGEEKTVMKAVHFEKKELNRRLFSILEN
ncbi:MAG TPA: hypothetical protein VKM36_09735 [Balneolaceae bacterium]|nr:hypothetical protein [Balneolaceae bacterium]